MMMGWMEVTALVTSALQLGSGQTTTAVPPSELFISTGPPPDLPPGFPPDFPRRKTSPPCNISPEKGKLFISENFPENYESNTNCNYTMEARDAASRVVLTFHLFDTEPNSRCSYDLATIFDTNGTAIHKFCGKANSPLIVTSTGHSLSFNFKTDSVQENSGFLASWNELSSDITEETEGNYLVSFPHTFIEASEEKICVELFGEGSLRGEGSVTTNVYVKEDLLSGKATLTDNVEILPTDTQKCFTVNLGNAINSSKAIINYKGKFSSSNYNFNTYKEVNILGRETYNLIQTDKGQYKPKDSVKFRIMLVDHDLKPSTMEKVDEIWVEDARNRRIQQWRDQPLDRGMIQQEFTLAKEPTLGYWSINFKVGDLKQKTRFQVSEYVLPKFEVEVDPPAAIRRDAETATWKVCGTYTHGGSVKGIVKYNFSSTYRRSTWRPPPPTVKSIASQVQVKASEDCATLELNEDQMKKLTVDNNVDNFQLHVEMEEAGTKVIRKATWSGSLVDQAFKLDYSSSSDKFILGGFPYAGEFKATNHDGTPVAGEPLEICVRLFKDISDIRKIFNNRAIWSMDEDEIVEAAEKMWKIRYSSKCHNAKTDGDGLVKFFVPLGDVPENVVKLSIKAKATNYKDDEKTKMKQPVKKLDVALTHTKSAMTISIQDKEREKIPCNQQFTTKVYFSSLKDSTLDLHYYAIAKGALFKSENIKVTVGSSDSMSDLIAGTQELKANDDDFSRELSGRIVSYQDITLDVDYRVSPTLKLVVFTRDGATTLTDSHTYDVEPCQKHEVAVNWSKKKVNPGDPIKLSVAAGAGARCGVSATDKSVELLDNSNKVTKVKVGLLLKEISQRKINAGKNNNHYYRDSCPDVYNAIKVFESTGIDILTNLNLINSCKTIKDAINFTDKEPEYLNGSGAGGQFASGLVGFGAAQAQVSGNSAGSPPGVQPLLDHRVGAEGGNKKKGVSRPKLEIRNYFPETWLFEMVDTEGSNGFSRDMNSPHTITEWKAEAVCINMEDGLGVASPQTLLVTQDFFAQLSLPYSVKRGEVFPLNISVFNYVDYALPIRVSLKNNDDEITTQTQTIDICVGSKDNEVVTINAKAATLGNVNITVEARITKDITNCRNVEEGEGYSDTLIKPLRVKPEGFPVEKVESEFKCLESSGSGVEEFKMSPLIVPASAVPDSQRAWVYVTGDIMAPALQNVGNLVNLPTGCGEQNMVGLVPNIFLLQYLEATKQEEPELERKAKEYMQVGYDRQHKYKHPSGGYSIWGKSDKNASTWLTAFVVKSFSEASEFIDVDQKDVEESVSFLMSLQKENGCFRSSGYVYSSSLKGGSSDESLTPFVVVALLEASDKMGIDVNTEKINNAVLCMVQSLNETDIYTSTLTTYAANLVASKYKAQGKKLDSKLMKNIGQLWPRVKAKANTSIAGDLFWDKTETVDYGWWSYSRSKAVEMTAYNVLTMTLLDELPEAVNAVKWLARQRNSKGGFVSTQDTVVALQALSLYAQRVTTDPLEMSIDVVENHETKTKLDTFKMNADNSLLLQTQKLTSLPSKLVLTANGQGCAMVQTVLRYNVPEVEENQGFTLKVENVVDGKLKVCSAYTGERDKTGMVVLELELVTGWEVHSLDYLINTVDSFVKRHEVDVEENKVVLYFDDMPKEERCVEVPVKMVTLVEDAKDAIATVYDYYNKEDTVSIKYNMM